MNGNALDISLTLGGNMIFSNDVPRNASEMLVTLRPSVTFVRLAQLVNADFILTILSGITIDVNPQFANEFCGRIVNWEENVTSVKFTQFSKQFDTISEIVSGIYKLDNVDLFENILHDMRVIGF